MLGYHSKSTDKSTLVYSRDVMAWPLRHLGKVLKLVQKGLFDPDCTRSGRWTTQQDEAACDAFNKMHAAMAENVVDSDPFRHEGKAHPPQSAALVQKDQFMDSISLALNRPHEMTIKRSKRA